MSVRQAIKSALGLLNRRDRRLLSLSIAIQMATSLLDLVGVLLIGLVGALAVTVVQSQPPPATVSSTADILGLGGLDGKQLIVALAGAAAVVLLTKSVVSSYLTRRVFIFLANRQALVSARLTKALLSRPLTFLQRRSSQMTAYALIQGAGLATIQILGQMAIAVTEATLLVVLAIALLFLDPIVTLAAIAFFALVAWGLQRALGSWAARLGRDGAAADIASLNAVQEALSSYREVSVSHRRALYVERIQALRWEAAKVAADVTFVGLLPKYIFEAALVVAGFALAGVLFATQDAVTAVGTLALFLAAGSRVTPSLLRLQGAALSLRGAAGGAVPTFALAEDLGRPLDAPEDAVSAEEIVASIESGYPGFEGSVRISGASFTYPGAQEPAIDGVSLALNSGRSLALVGASGAGKSTLADLILGLLDPESGSVTVSGLGPSDAIGRWPGAIAYVPQETVLANASIRENVALGLPGEFIDDDRVWDALRRAHLEIYLREERDGLDTQIGEGGLKLSGGQRQRLGIARALYSGPKLLVLDEATSALDADTETSISRMISELEGEVTTIVIAHRLSTVRHVDSIYYLEGGRVSAFGTFNEVLAAVPAFRRQAALMGLSGGGTE